MPHTDRQKLVHIMRALKGSTYQDIGERKEMQRLGQTEVWVDPTPNLIEGIFYLNQESICVRCCCPKRKKNLENEKIVIYDNRSLYCLHSNNPIRKWLV